MVEANRTVDPRRSVSVRPADKPVVVAPKPTANVVNNASTNTAAPKGESRLEQQQRYFGNMWSQLGQDARLASVMFNPLFAIHAQAIAHAATVEAFRRYETEVPQKEFSVLYAEESARARIAILNLPHLYAEKGAAALEATGGALLFAANATAEALNTAYDATSDAVVEAYDVTSSAVTTAAEATGNFFTRGAQMLVGGIAAAGLGLLHGIGWCFSGIGSIFNGAGHAMENVGN
ncbi:MAG: hypothetical protein JWM80_6383 [Cyanobacteria bacterium RYN_339]|nr:hypothetical protein [Cyanobacteria bacterium RYN_339]